MSTQTDDVKNVGYGILKELYKQLEIDKFWNWKTRILSIGYSVDQIFRLLVFSRVLNPASKKGTFEQKDFYFEDFGDFSIDDVYHALDIICDNNEALQKWIYGHSDKICKKAAQRQGSNDTEGKRPHKASKEIRQSDFRRIGFLCSEHCL